MKFKHEEFPGIEVRDCGVPWNTYRSYKELCWNLSCLVNNELANTVCRDREFPKLNLKSVKMFVKHYLARRKERKLYLFFRRLARDIDGVGSLISSSDSLSPATKGNLEHFYRRALGDNTGW